MISVLILTYNEEKNMIQCLESLTNISDDIHVLDSYSDDATIDIAKTYLEESNIHFRKFDNYSLQRNWGLKEIDFKYDWLLMLDADEVVTEEVSKSIQDKIKNVSEEVVGFEVKLRMVFINKLLKYRLWPLKRKTMFRHKDVEFYRDINEHLVSTNNLRKKWEMLDGFLLHKDNKTFHDHLAKHNHYSTMEAFRILEEKNDSINWRRINEMIEIKKIFYRLPFRNFLYFYYLYIWKMGFLDGSMGFKFIMSRIQYQMDIDLKMKEIKANLLEKDNYISFKK